jgi:hypothetical protein
VIKVNGRAQPHADRAGDPLDGLVNMFDLGIVLAVAFLIAALQSVNLTKVLTDRKSLGKPGAAIVVNEHQKLVPLKPGQRRVRVTGGGRVGAVYRLPDGRLVYVANK